MSDFFSRLIAILNTTPERWRALTSAVPPDLLFEQPKRGEWSAVECLQHLIDTENVFQSRLSAFREGRDFPAFNPDAEGSKPGQLTPEAMADLFTSVRAKSLRQLDDITPDDLSLRARHAELGPVTLEQMLNEWAAHDLNHTVQAERALMQPFLRECGPWQTYFADHMVANT